MQPRVVVPRVSCKTRFEHTTNYESGPTWMEKRKRVRSRAHDEPTCGNARWSRREEPCQCRHGSVRGALPLLAVTPLRGLLARRQGLRPKALLDGL